MNKIKTIKSNMADIIPLKEKNLPTTCLVFKHSTQCPISAAAAEQVKKLNTNLPIYWINVIEERDFSNWIEKQYGTRHESPQLLLLTDGAVSKVWNHRDVKGENILPEINQ